MSHPQPSQWPPLDSAGRIVWPNDEAERVQLARRLFGEAIVGTTDYWIDHASDLITNPEPPRPYLHENSASEQDKVYRKCFATLSNNNKQVISHFIYKIVDGVVVSLLSRLDQFGCAGDRVEISLIGKGPDGEQVEVPVTAVEEEMHQQYHSWQEEFGKHSENLTTDLPNLS